MEEKSRVAAKFRSTPGFDTVLRKYIPAELLENVDTLSLVFENRIAVMTGDSHICVQTLMDNSNNKLRMYGNAKELNDQILFYGDFTSAHRFFNMPMYEPFLNSVRIFHNLKNEQFMNKQDMIVGLEAIFMSWGVENDNIVNLGGMHKVINSLISIFIKSYIPSSLEPCIELVRYDKAYFEKIQKMFEETEEKFATTTDLIDSRYYMPSNNLSIEECFNQWMQLFFHFKTQSKETMEGVMTIVELFYKQDLHVTHPEIYVGTLYYCDIILKLTKKILDGSPEKFKPYNYKTNKTAPITVRVFEEEGVPLARKYVMKTELFKAIDPKYTENQKDDFGLKYDDFRMYEEMMDLENVFSQYKGKIDNIEFIRVPIRRNQFSPIPIMTPSGGYCMTSYDGFKHLLHRLIFIDCIFQRIKMDSFSVLSNYFKHHISDYFDAEMAPFFITFTCLDDLIRTTKKNFREFEKIPVKYVRNAKKDGFTLQNLIKELINLGITDIFPQITDYAESAYQLVLEEKAEEVLRTCDLFKAIELCVTSEVHKNWPDIWNFFPHFRPNLKTSGELEEIRKKEEKEKDMKKKGELESELKSEQPMSATDDLVDELCRKLADMESKCKSKDEEREKLELELERMKAESERMKEAIESKLKISEQKTEKMQEQMEKMKNESDKVIRGMEMEKKKENAENRKIVKELTESDAKHSKRVTELEFQLEEEKKKTQKVEQEAKQQKSESHRKFVGLETENKKLSKSLEQQKIDRESLQKKIRKEYSEKLNQMKNQLKERDLTIENEKKENSDFREMNSAIKRSMEEELNRKTEGITELLLKIADLESRLKNFEQGTEEMDRELVQNVQDDECGICMSKMNPNELIFECNHCKKETHLKCSQKWFQQNSTCVHCRGLVRLPSDFPSLS